MTRYLVPYKCTNCLYAARVAYPKGHEAMNYFECPECGMKTFNKRTLNVVLTDVYRCDDGFTLTLEPATE